MPTRRNTPKPARPDPPKEGYPQRGRGRDRIKRQSDDWEEVERVDVLPVLPNPDYPTGSVVLRESDSTFWRQDADTWVSGGDSFTDLGLLNFRVTDQDNSSIRYEWNRDTRVSEIWVYNIVVEQPVTGDNWPAQADSPDQILSTNDFFEVDLPRPGKARLLQFEPRADDLQLGPVRRAIVEPTSPRTDRLREAQLSLDEQFNVDLTVKTEGAASIRYAISKSGPPTVADVESGTVSTTVNGTIQNVSSVDVATETGPFRPKMEDVWVRVVAYVNGDGTGPGGVTDHDDSKVSKLKRDGFGREHWGPSTDPNLRSLDTDTSSAGGVVIRWDAFTMQTGDSEYDVPSGDITGVDPETTYAVYISGESGNPGVMAVLNSSSWKTLGVARHFVGTITTVADKTDGSATDTTSSNDSDKPTFQ